MKKLNKQQQEAVFSTDKKLLCLAGAGTGKTTCMLSRIEYLIDNGVNPSSILVLTFTNAAALEMASRYLKSNQTACPEFRTFHSFCYSLIVSDSLVRSAIGYVNKVPDIATEEEEKSVADFVNLQISFKMNPKNIRKLIWTENGLRYQEAVWKNAYLNELRRRQKITFDVLCTCVCKLFSEDKECISRYKSKYKYIFVDEFQDTDVQQWEFVKSFNDAYLFLVGDALQSIYQFRGCTNEIMKRLANDKSWSSKKLTENYRSTKKICDYSNAFSVRCSDPSYRVAIHSDRIGPDVRCKDFKFFAQPYGDYCREAMAALSSELSKIPESEDCAVLVRTNKEVESVSRYLAQHEIAHSTKEVDAEQSVKALQSAINNEFFIEFLESKLSPQHKFEWIRMSCSSDMDIKSKITLFFNLYSTDYRVKKVITDVLQIRKLITKSGGAHLACKSICEYLKLDISPEKILDIASDSNNSISLIEHLVEEIGNKPQFEKRIYVGTIHSVKGLEFDNVIVLGVGSKTFPVYSGEDMMNLFYVAITRAKSHLTIYKDKNFSLDLEDEEDGITNQNIVF